jgi:hypothetical protein
VQHLIVRHEVLAACQDGAGIGLLEVVQPGPPAAAQRSSLPTAASSASIWLLVSA